MNAANTIWFDDYNLILFRSNHNAFTELGNSTDTTPPYFTRPNRTRAACINIVCRRNKAQTIESGTKR